MSSYSYIQQCQNYKDHLFFNKEEELIIEHFLKLFKHKMT